MSIKGMQAPKPASAVSVGPEMLGWREVTELTGMSRKVIINCQKADHHPFPKRRQVPSGGKWFLRSEVVRWMERLPKVEEDAV